MNKKFTHSECTSIECVNRVQKEGISTEFFCDYIFFIPLHNECFVVAHNDLNDDFYLITNFTSHLTRFHFKGKCDKI